MATDGGFKHIKVTPAEEQEVVIHAGAPSVPEAAKEASPASAEPTATPQPKATPREPYQGTTLADIEGSKMPKMQVAIIVIAVLAIIAFAVWYAFFS